MNNTTTFSRWNGADRARKRQRPQRVEVVKCDCCGTVYDVMPFNPQTRVEQCPQCKAEGSWLRRTFARD